MKKKSPYIALVCALILLLTAAMPVFATAPELDLTPNHYSVIDPDSDKVIYNGHEYEYDITSGATVLPSRGYDGVTPTPIPLDEKEDLLYWSIQPPQGLIEGEYWRLDEPFGHFDATYIAAIDLVVNDGKIVHIEMDEQMPDSYYNQTFAGQYKRRTGYTFFQFEKPRTDTTKVTWANGITFLEWQILHANSLDIDFNTVYGSTNSPRDGFIPAIKTLKGMVNEPSGQYYIGLAKPLGTGVTARLELVFEGEKIIKAKYDEILADKRDDVTDEALKPFYRQSKYDSIAYNEANKNAFVDFSKALEAAIIEKQELVESLDGALPEFENYLTLVPALNDAIAAYKKDGYEHNIGTIDKRPEGMPVNESAVSRQDDVDMKLISYSYDAEGQKLTMNVEMTNKSEKDYAFTTGSFYAYVMNTENVYDTIADENIQNITLKAGETKDLELHMGPIYETDTDMSLKYDGANKIYYSMTLKPELEVKP